jgi:predicted RNA-binding protein YlxR (DUF448 family)
LVRFVVGPDQTVVPDIQQKLPGRGLWLMAKRDIIIEASLKNVFSIGRKNKILVPEDLADRVEKLLRQRCLKIISLARRAGQMVGGYEKVRSFLSNKNAGLILAASDGAEHGINKVAKLATNVPVIVCFSSSELGLTIGREKLVHAVISRGGFDKTLRTEITRLLGMQNEMKIESELV